MVFTTRTDTEVLAKLLAKSLVECGADYVEALRLTASEIDGACSLVLVNDEGELYAYRDPLGFRPLCVGSVDDLVLAASESCALNAPAGLNECAHEPVNPGELIRVSKVRIASPPRRARRMFEYVYFARPDGVIDGISVYKARERIGRELAERFPVEADVVPDSGGRRPSATPWSRGCPSLRGS